MIVAAIVFDLDGVIVDSNQAIFATYQQTARIIGVRVPSNE